MPLSTQQVAPLHQLLRSADAAHRAQAHALLSALNADDMRRVLSGIRKLREADLHGLDLSACALKGKNLEEANLSQANLRGVDLQGARLDGSDLRGADLRGANLSGQTVWWADLSDADLRGADLRGAHLHHTRLCRSSLTQANIESLRLSFCRVDGLDLPGKVVASAEGLWGSSAAMAMAWIPPGTFWMGSPDTDTDAEDDEKPQREVTIPLGFWMGTVPVTQGLWQEVTGSNPSGFTGHERRPVERVSWGDAVIFANRLSQREGLKPAYTLPSGFVAGMDRDTCDTLHSGVQWDREADGYRLPTKAEWEYAARAGTTTRYWSGDAGADLARVGWYKANSGKTTHPVGEKKAPNPWGLHDIHGNVLEWCFDTYETNEREIKNYVYPVFSGGTYRVIRGGSWSSSPGFARAAFHDGYGPGYSGSNLGFRLVRSAVPQH